MADKKITREQRQAVSKAVAEANKAFAKVQDDFSKKRKKQKQQHREYLGKDYNPLLGDDTSVLEDIGGVIKRFPDNVFYIFYNPKKTNLDDLGRLVEKTLQAGYRPALRAVELTAWLNPRLRETKIESLRKLDLDAYTYIEPILYHADRIVLKHLDGWVSQKSNWSQNGFLEKGDETKERPNIFNFSDDLAIRIKDLAEGIEINGPNEQNTKSYKKILKDICIAQDATRKQIEEINQDVEKVLSLIDKISARPPGKDSITIKMSRLESLREHMLNIRSQGTEMYNQLQQTKESMVKISETERYTTEKFSEKLTQCGKELGNKAAQKRLMSQQMADQAYVRQERKKRIRNQDGQITGHREAQIEHYRKSRLAIETCFTPNVPRTLRIKVDKSNAPNPENYFISAIDSIYKQSFDEEGNPLEVRKRGPKFGTDLAEYIVKTYAAGAEEDALLALQMLKYLEGAGSQELFPEKFRDLLSSTFTNFYGMSASELDKDEHVRAFIGRAVDISGERDHSPEVGENRDMKKQVVLAVKDYIYGRMYPSANQYFATPLNHKMIRKPLYKMHGKFLAYITGGSLVPVGELGRKIKEGSVLEKEAEMGIKHNWLWWKAQPAAEGEEQSQIAFFRDAPAWAKMIMNNGRIASIPAAALLAAGIAGTGGIAAPLYVAVPVIALGMSSAADYGLKAAKATWALPLVHKPVKFAAKWSAITAGSAAAIYFLGPGALVLATTYPMTAALVTSPVWGLAALKMGLSAADSIFTSDEEKKKRKEGSFKEVTFEIFRQENSLSNEPSPMAEPTFMPDNKNIDEIELKMIEPEHILRQKQGSPVTIESLRALTRDFDCHSAREHRFQHTIDNLEADANLKTSEMQQPETTDEMHKAMMDLVGAADDDDDGPGPSGQ